MNLEDYRDRVSRFVGMSGIDFDAAVLACINSVLDDIRTYCFKENLPEALHFDTNYPLSDKEYGRMMWDGILYYIQHYPVFVREPNIPVAYNRYLRSLALAQYHAIMEIDPEAGTPDGTWA